MVAFVSLAKALSLVVYASFDLSTPFWINVAVSTQFCICTASSGTDTMMRTSRVSCAFAFSMVKVVAFAPNTAFDLITMEGLLQCVAIKAACFMAMQWSTMASTMGSPDSIACELITDAASADAEWSMKYDASFMSANVSAIPRLLKNKACLQHGAFWPDTQLHIVWCVTLRRLARSF